jgi:(4-(4-[2-(gamma-L-glutamylamino)ethyl]phenoxymethyl)furan-2-yl)methanamine synthase
VSAVLGLDIGGANLKAVHSAGNVRVQPFPLWKNPAELTTVLGSLMRSLPPADVLAVTMTGELCDCFDTKRQGVQAILDAVAAVGEKRSIRVWTTTDGFVDLSTARNMPLQVAAANWSALATFACRFVPEGVGLVMDIGSTTTDIIPIAGGKPVPKGLTDPERLASLELVYTGVRRTPLCAVLGGGVAAELFATTLDVNLVLDRIAEDESDRNTADGRPATKTAAHARLARMLCADAETIGPKETTKLAERALLRQVVHLTMAFDHVARTLPEPPRTVVLAGEGEFLARLVLGQQNSFRGGNIISLTESLGAEISRAACAYALTQLALDRKQTTK